jgi:hypothetical protein
MLPIVEGSHVGRPIEVLVPSAIAGGATGRLEFKSSPLAKAKSDLGEAALDELNAYLNRKFSSLLSAGGKPPMRPEMLDNRKVKVEILIRYSIEDRSEEVRARLVADFERGWEMVQRLDLPGHPEERLT